MKNRFLLAVLWLCSCFGASAQTIVKAEYFVDTDPGINAATDVPITSGATISNVTFNRSLTSLSAGMHNLYFRVKDSNGFWSTTERAPFYNLAPITVPPAVNITNAEYFVDTDPGIGAATAITITPGLSISNLTLPVSVTSLTEGSHKLFLRVKDANGFWSATEGTPFWKLTTTPPPAAVNITNAEYFVDTDPGIGAATAITITPGLAITDLAVVVNVSSLTEGSHKLFVRFKDANNKWSVSQPSAFSVCNQVAPVPSAATNITTTGFTANWAAATGATSYRLDVSADNFTTFVSGNNDRTITGATTATVTGLTIGTAYKYRVRAVNATCASISSAAIDVSTLFTSPSATAATSITTSGFTANWNAVTNATGYRLDVSADDFATFVTNYSNKTVTASNDVVTGLTAATAYKYRVRAVNAAGAISGNSTSISVTTATAIAAPVANAATVITATGFTANWLAVSGATGYRLDVSADNFATFVTNFSDKTVTATNDVVTGLTAATAYKYRVRAVNANGTSVNSNAIDVTTSAAGTAPAIPVAIAASVISSTGFTANWNTVTGATGYQLDISADNFATFLTGYSSKSVTAITEVVTGLTASTAYKYRVRATNTSGTSASSNVIDVTTGAVGTAPATPVAIAATTISSTGFTANWNTVTGATGYQLDISTDNFATFVTGYNSKSVTAIIEVVTGLTASTAYKYRVRATNGSGASGNSNIISVSTSGNCTAAHTFNICLTSNHAYINSVTVMSGASTVLSNVASGCPLNSVSTIGYSDYTSISGQLTPGAGYSGSVVTNAGGCLFTSVFIDYNSNGLFTDAGELVYQRATALCGDGAINSFTFTVPANAITGTTRMRVRSNGSGEGVIADPCVGYIYGESEDYSILISPSTPVASAATIISSTGFTANWNTVSGATGYQLDVSADNFATFIVGYNSKAATATTELVSGLTSVTSYSYRVRATNASGTSSNSNIINVFTPPFLICTGGVANGALAAPTSSYQTASFVSAGLYKTFTAIQGILYNFSFCGNGGSATYDTEISILDNSGLATANGYNDDYCGPQSDLIWLATANGTYRILITAYNCDPAGGSAATLAYATLSLLNPPAPVATIAYPISPTDFTANWNAVSGATDYRLDVSADNFATFITGFNNKTVITTSDAVTGLTASTNYRYRVRAVNSNGTSISSKVIYVTTGAAGTAPVTPGAIAATAILPTGFTANWNAVSGATGYRLDISTDNFVTFIVGYNSRSVTATTRIVTGLTSSTAYKYRVRANNASGTSASSNVIDVTTLVEVPIAPVAIAATAISPIGFTANWNTVTGATGYQLDISTDNFATFIAGYNSKALTAITEVVTGLTASTAYKYRVRAANTSGTSASSNVIDVTTLVEVPIAPVAIAATAISPTGFTANWNTVTAATGYQLDISTDNFATFIAGYNSKAVTAISEVVSGLTASTAYKYRVRAANTSGTSASSNVIDVTTLPLPTVAPVATAATAITQTGFTANWGAAAGATGYLLDVSADNFASLVIGFDNLVVTTTSKTVTGLTANTAHKYRVRATSTAPTSVNSNVIDVTTLPVPVVAAPVATAATAITSTGFTANWVAVTGATGYRLDVSSDNFVNLITGFADKTVTGTSDAVTGLTLGTAYKYRVRAIDATSTSVNSNVIDVTTLAKQSQTITFAAISDKTLGGSTFTIGATASSGLTVSYATASDKITIANGVATIVKAGRETIEASQAGDATFNAATTVKQSFCIKPAKPIITASGTNTETITLTSSASAGNQWFKDGTAISGATSATLSVTTVGVYKLQIKVDDCLSEFSADTPFIITGDISTQTNGITIYPNPVEDYLEVRGLKGEISTSQLADMTGKINTLRLEQKSSVHSANVQHLAAGVYLLRVQQGNSIYQIKFIKK